MAVTISGTSGITYPVQAGTANTTQASSARVLQVVQSVKTDTASSSSTTFADITGLSVSITPTSSSSKILVLVDCALGTGGATAALIKILRGATTIYVGDAAGSRPLVLAQVFTSGDYWTARTPGIYLDSPATTSSVTYKLQLASTGATAVYVNRTNGDRDSTTYDGRTASSITVMEIAQ